MADEAFLVNPFLALRFAITAQGLTLRHLTNRITNHQLSFHTDSVLQITTGSENTPLPSSAYRLLDFRHDEQNSRLTVYLHHEAAHLNITQMLTFHGPVARMQVCIHNVGSTPIQIRDVTLFTAVCSEAIRQGQNTVDLTKGDPGAFLTSTYGGAYDANPLFIGDDLFMGIDWPVAENACRDNELLCRQFPGRTLAPDEQWQSRTFSIGVSAQGKVAAAFLAHLDALRNRPTRRASFYFDWLLHASEGPTAAELYATLQLFRRLRADHGIQFDIYALDDGAFETRWELMFDRYRLEHDRLFPGGLKPLVGEMTDLGMQLGAWLGPDVVYRNDPEDTQRFHDIVQMVRDWHVDLIKLDVCVSWPLRADPYHNEWYMNKLVELYDACRAIMPDLVVINHRIRFSPYILTVLDSTLWEGAESYPDVFLGNSHTPRLFTRYAAYGRKSPTYYGEYSPLLEDHGICFNGDWRGWREEFILGAFGRALALSPEIYGTLFLLPDHEYPELGRLMQLARQHRTLLAHTSYLPESGDFLHSDGTQALRCLINDSWQSTTRTLQLDQDFALSANDETTVYRVTVHYTSFPDHHLDGLYDATAVLNIPLRPFDVALLQIEVAQNLSQQPAKTASVLSSLPQTEDLGTLLLQDPAQLQDPQIALALETTRFAVNSDTPELQALERLPASQYGEVEACRTYYRTKQFRECVGHPANAWDDDPLTSWGDDYFWSHTSNVWRLDLGSVNAVERVEVDLSLQYPGPVLTTTRDTLVEKTTVRGLSEPIFIEISPDLQTWHTAQATIFYRRIPSGLEFPHAFIAKFPQPVQARYIRILARGFRAQQITVRGPNMRPLRPWDWRGNNTLTTRPPLALYSSEVQLPSVTANHLLAVICNLGEQVTIQPNTEIALAWAHHNGTLIPLVEASPMLLSHRWEYYCQLPGNNIVFRLPLSESWSNTPLQLSVALFSPEYTETHWNTTYTPEIRALCVPASPYLQQSSSHSGG